MGFDLDVKKNLDKQLDEERERRFGWERSSEELMRQEFSDDRKNRPALTGYKPLKKEEPPARETMRMENSRGIIALGGDERKKPALVVTKKAHPHGPAVTERERVLEEKGERGYIAGKNSVITNPGGREKGAVGLLLAPGQTRIQMIGYMKRYMDGRGRETLGYMMPFMVTGRDLAYKRQLEEALQEARRDMPQGDMARMLDRLLDEKKEDLTRKRQVETSFGQRLEKSVEEQKETLWKHASRKDASGMAARIWKRAGSETDDIPDDDSQDEDEGEKILSRKECFD